ncbi:hypothetical protein DPMN_011139 [Dreissena polymorpha]|uniref:Uncharacterized protein n=1 Tax=Dreissena polymorpha TaxID=45954 RepID=A0A9D4N3C0_DREPO|nr:hypothetical protein DPMN_011139 [Dreissena polymorpha]
MMNIKYKRKKRVKKKTKDTERAKTDKSVYVATFDLQAVLTTPCSLSLPTSSKEKDFVPMESDEEDTDIE